MALNKRTRTLSKSTEAKSEAAPTPVAENKSTDLTALQTALAQIVQLVTELSAKLETANGRIDDLSSKVDDLEAKLNAALEDDDSDEDEDSDDSEEDSEDDSEEDGDDVTADDIDCNKAYKQLTSLDADQQKVVLVEAMKSLGVKSLQARAIRKDANAALAVAEVMCSDKFGWDVDDFLKD